MTSFHHPAWTTTLVVHPVARTRRTRTAVQSAHESESCSEIFNMWRCLNQTSTSHPLVAFARVYLTFFSAGWLPRPVVSFISFHPFSRRNSTLFFFLWPWAVPSRSVHCFWALPARCSSSQQQLPLHSLCLCTNPIYPQYHACILSPVVGHRGSLMRNT